MKTPSIAGDGAALDGRAGQLVQAKTVAKQAEQAQFLRLDRKVGGGDLHGKRIGGVVEPGRQGIAHGFEDDVETFAARQQLGAVARDRNQLLVIEALEDRQGVDEFSDPAEFPVVHRAVDGRGQYHDVDQGLVSRKRLVHDRRSPLSLAD